MTEWKADLEIDCDGLLCPLPVLRARKRLLGMAPGQVLCVSATDAMAAIDLPHFCNQSGHDYLGCAPAAEPAGHGGQSAGIRYYIRVGG